MQMSKVTAKYQITLPLKIRKEMSKVTAKYQITLPLKIRKELGIVPGAEVTIS